MLVQCISLLIITIYVKIFAFMYKWLNICNKSIAYMCLMQVFCVFFAVASPAFPKRKPIPPAFFPSMPLLSERL